MSDWVIKLKPRITEITRDFVEANIPPGTTNVVIPEGVKRIGERAFYFPINFAIMSDKTNDIESVIIPKGVESIGKEAFHHCINLKKVCIPEGVKSIGERAFSGCGLESVEIPGSVESFGKEAFYFCQNLKSVVIADGVKSIGESAFWSCLSLKTVVIFSTLKSIDRHAFESCTSLISIVIPDGVWISLLAFKDCPSLNLIVLPCSFVKNLELLDKSGLTTQQKKTVTPYGQFISDWKCRHDLEFASYSDKVILFLYQLQNIESFEPCWNEVSINYPEIVGVEDIIRFSADKYKCKPMWARVGYEGPSNNTACLQNGSSEFDQFGNVISNWFTVKDAAAFACVAKSKYIRPVSSQSLFSRLRSNAGISKVLGLSSCAVIAIGIGITFMQRYSDVSP